MNAEKSILLCDFFLRATDTPSDCSKLYILKGHFLEDFLLQGNRHSLTVLSVEKGHLGVYACHAANAYGADSKKIEVSGDDVYEVYDVYDDNSINDDNNNDNNDDDNGGND